MPFVRQYQLTPLEGRLDDLVTVLTALGSAVLALPGSIDVQIMSSPDRSTILFLEHWSTREAHKAAAGLLGSGAFDPVMALLAIKPRAGEFESHPITRPDRQA